MKKRFLSLSLAGVMLAGLLSGCHDKNDLAQIAALQAENASLSAALESLKSDYRALECTILSDWAITAEPLEDEDGAAVRFEAQAMEVRNGQSMHFVIMRGGKTVVDLPCAFDGSVFTASAQIDAQNGYTFFCDLSNGKMEPIRYALLDPENETLNLLMNLYDSMNTYATVHVDNWKEVDGTLLLDANVQVQLPGFSADGKVAVVESAVLNFTVGEKVLSSKDIPLDGSDGALTADMKNITCTIPEDTPTDAQVSLSCTVKLSDGQVLTAEGGGWYLQNDQLQMIAG